MSVSGQDHSTVVIGSSGGYGRVKDQGSGGRASKGLFKDALVRSASKQSLAEDASRHDDEGKGANNHSLSQDDHDYDDDAKGLPAQVCFFTVMHLAALLHALQRRAWHIRWNSIQNILGHKDMSQALLPRQCSVSSEGQTQN